MPFTQVLPLYFLLRLVKDGLVKDLAFAQPRIAQPLLDFIGFECLHSTERDGGDSRALFDNDYQDVLFNLETNISEKTGRKQRSERLRGLLVGHRLAYFHRQITEDGARLDALNTLYADILYRKRVECVSNARKERLNGNDYYDPEIPQHVLLYPFRVLFTGFRHASLHPSAIAFSWIQDG